MGLFKKNKFSEIDEIDSIISFYIKRIPRESNNRHIEIFSEAFLMGAQMTLELLLEKKDEGFNYISNEKDNLDKETVKNLFKLCFMYYFLSYKNHRSGVIKLDHIKNVFDFTDKDLSKYNNLSKNFPSTEEESSKYAIKYTRLFMHEFGYVDELDPFFAMYLITTLSNTLTNGVYTYIKNNQ